LRPTVWLLISICLFGAITENVLRQGMPRPVSPRYTLYALPIAVDLLRGRTHDYSAAMTTANHFIRHPEDDTQSQIRDALASSEPDAGIWFVSGDDKGLVDLTYGSFVVFGPELNSIVKLTLVLTGLSFALFALQFHREDGAMAALVATLCGYYAILFSVGLTHEAVSMSEPRILGAVTVVSSLHLMLTAARRDRLAAWTWAGLLLQTSLLTFVVHMRASEVWQVLAIATFALAVMMWRRQWTRPALVVLLVLAGGLGGLAAYKRATFNEHYYEKDVATRVFWHNALMGLAINPALHQAYGFNTLDDVSVTEAVRSDMRRNGRTEAAAALFPNETYSSGNFYSFDWATYESEARRLYLQIWTNNFDEVAKTYLDLMPRVIAQELDYLSNRNGVQGLLLGGLIQIVSPEERRERDLFYTPLRLLPVFACMVAVLLLSTGRRPTDGAPLAALMLLSGCSIIPPYIATPAPQYLMVPLLLGGAAVYLAAAAGLAWGLRFAFRLRDTVAVMLEATVVVPQRIRSASELGAE
jgi:hypothetical protein